MLVSDDIVGNRSVHVRKILRKANLEMFITCLKAFHPWMFALDHVHYARWLLVYL